MKNVEEVSRNVQKGEKGEKEDGQKMGRVKELDTALEGWCEEALVNV